MFRTSEHEPGTLYPLPILIVKIDKVFAQMSMEVLNGEIYG
jgi:hypothetical protein